MLSATHTGARPPAAAARAATAPGRRGLARPAPRPSLRCRSAGVEGNPLFNDQFMSVFRESLARQGGEDALLSGPKKTYEPRMSASEEVLGQALAQSRQTLATMIQWREMLEKQIAAQQKQVERVEFALNKVRSDSAYLSALKDLMHED